MEHEEAVSIFCPDCRGVFDMPPDELVEGELIECSLCAAEIEVLEENPVKLRLYSEENEF